MSWLFAPGDRPDRCRKALASPADQVILDLEDGVAPADRKRARQAVLSLVSEGEPKGRRPWVRLNAVQGDLGQEDLKTFWEALSEGHRRFLIPRADRSVFDALQTLADGAEWVFLVETGKALWEIQREGVPRAWRGKACRFSLAALDYQLDMGGSTGPQEEELLLLRTQIALASRAGEWLPPVDAVYPLIDDLEGLKASAGRARRLGFVGKLLIHPKQIEVVHRAFAPSPEERTWAERVLAASGGAGAVRVDGLMVDRPVVDRARQILAQFQGARE
jgi:citrate lyase beta subunit